MNLFINFAAFQVGWFSSVLGGAKQLPWAGPLAVLAIVALHLYRSDKPQVELKLILACGVLGTVFDSLLVAANWVGYPSGMFSSFMAPYWIIAMWMLFATTLNVSMGWMKGRPWLAAVMGLIAGPLTYIAGHKLGGIEFANQTAALIALGLGWAVMMPALMKLAEHLDGGSAGSGDVLKQGSAA
ncbi:MAG: DUF2878 domain-containing protein [Woeseiaceae bacterium]|nr:DUF2878 domain-containing protein [Woeseiaceae bacterium]